MNHRCLVAAVASLTFVAAASARPVDLALWTFEISLPVTAGPHAAEGGAGSAFCNTGGVISNPVGNGSFESMSSTAWNVGDNHEFRTSTAGYQSISITWDQASSSTGPRDFDLQISVDGGTTYASIFSYMVLLNGAPNVAWSSGGARQLNFSYTMSLGATADNLADLRVRMTNSSTVSASGATVASTGTSRIDNVQISGDLIPTPGTVVLAGLAGVVGIRRRRA